MNPHYISSCSFNEGTFNPNEQDDWFAYAFRPARHNEKMWMIEKIMKAGYELNNDGSLKKSPYVKKTCIIAEINKLIQETENKDINVSPRRVLLIAKNFINNLEEKEID